MKAKWDLWKNISKDAIVFSFDDGYVDDLKFAELLQKHGYRNVIFYVPIQNIEWKAVLNAQEIKKLSEMYEIGWHTYNHVDLTTLSLEDAEKEIVSWKEALEAIIGREITSFCLPRWHYNTAILDVVKKCWFTDCRSARLYNTHPSDQTNFLWHPNIHFYPHLRLIDLLHAIKVQDFSSFAMRIKHLKNSHLEMIPKILAKNQKIHIWWHSWEIDYATFEHFILQLNDLLWA